MERPQGANANKPLTFTLLATCTVAGIALGSLLLPSIFRSAPNELVRTRYIRDALTSAGAKPEIVFLGNSITMEGVDAKHFSSAIPGGPLAWNLSSTGQSWGESLLIFEELPPEVSSVILCVPPRYLGRRDHGVNRIKYGAYAAYGFNPSDEVKEVARTIDAEDGRAMDEGKLAVRFRSRWIVRAWIDDSARRLLRPEVDVERSMTDLYSPRAWDRRVSEAAYQRQASDIPFAPAEAGKISSESKIFLRFLKSAADRRSVFLAVVLMPESPDFRERTEEGFYREIDASLRWIEGDLEVPVWDFSTSLEPRQFNDPLHPGVEGAEVLTTLIAEAYQRWKIDRMP